MQDASFQKILGALFVVFACLLSCESKADLVKPALIEIVVTQNGEVTIDARLSIETLLAGINGQYKNTNEAPTAKEYDQFRVMSASRLKEEFEGFIQYFLSKIIIKTNENKTISISVGKVTIPEPGYTKVPRISVLQLSSNLPKGTTSLQWYYSADFGDNAVRLKQIDESAGVYHWSDWQWIRDDSSSKPFLLSEVEIKRDLYADVKEYIKLGFLHILPKGVDHILFILGLFFLLVPFKSMLCQVTVFTVAHSLTLGLSLFGIINLPENFVEPLIALSIVYIGIENLFAKKLRPSRLFIVFTFGLLHGLGFASVLQDFGLPASNFVIALVSFNIGVELGQLTIILFAIGLFRYGFGKKPWRREFVSHGGSLLVALIGFYWFVQRLDLNFLG